MRNKSLDERIVELERKIFSPLRREPAEAMVGGKFAIRPAKIADNSAYANQTGQFYPIIFLDGKRAAPSSPTLDTSDRQDVAITVAFGQSKIGYAIGDKVSVYSYKNQWYICGGGSSVRCCALLVNDVDGTLGPWDVNNVTSISGENPTTTGLIEIIGVYNPIGLKGSAGGFSIISQIKEATISPTIEAEKFIFDTIKCPVVVS